MKKLFWCMAIGICLVSWSCSTGWNTYSENMFHGKRLLQENAYAEARADFLRAAEAQRWPAAYAYAGTASYKMGDLAAAEQYLMEAQRVDGSSYAYLRVLGYQALTFLREGKVEQGRDALQRYAMYLRATSSPVGARQIEVWQRQQQMDLVALERMIDEQVNRYESDIEQFQSTGTGFYNRKGNYRIGPTVTP